MVATQNSISAERVREILRYDIDTGVFRWAENRGRKENGWVKVHEGDVCGHRSRTRGYIQIRVDFKKYYAHRLAWLFVYGEFPPGVIDHINGDTSDNRIANLRCVTQQENIKNMHVFRNKHGYPGVVFHKKSQTYHATIKVNKCPISLGYFKTAEDAGMAYMEAKEKRDSGRAL